MAKECMLVRHSLLTALQALGDAERGRLFTAMLIYSMGGEEAEGCSGNERIIWPIAKEMIDTDTAAYQEKVKKFSDMGKASVNARQRKLTQVDHSQPNPNPNPNPKSKANTPLTGGAGGDFDRFWKVYPKKVGKADAQRKFKAVGVDVETLIAAVERQKQSEQWRKENGRYIPNPATWLNQGRWEDELTSTQESTDDRINRLLEEHGNDLSGIW